MATTATIAPKKWDLLAGIRDASTMEQFQTVNIKELVKAVNADNVKIVTRKESGKHYMHLENTSTGKYYTIGFGKSVSTTATGVALIKELVNDYLVYTGINDNGQMWFSFGKLPEGGGAVVEVSVAELLKQGLKDLAGG